MSLKSSSQPSKALSLKLNASSKSASQLTATTAVEQAQASCSKKAHIQKEKTVPRSSSPARKVTSQPFTTTTPKLTTTSCKTDSQPQTSTTHSTISSQSSTGDANQSASPTERALRPFKDSKRTPVERTQARN